MNRNVLGVFLYWILISVGLSGCSLDVQLLESIKDQVDDQTFLTTYDGVNCVKRADSAPVCFGGQNPKPLAYNYPIKNQDIVKIRSGSSHSCAVLTTGRAYCWGGNGYGQLGDGSTTSSNGPVEIKKQGALQGKQIVDLALGLYHTCALDNEGHVACWGRNNSGQLGDGTLVSSRVPVAVNTSGVLSGKNIVAIASHGSNHACALDDQGMAYCWGANEKGQLGNDSAANSSVPVAVDTSGDLAGKSLVKIAAGQYHTCAIADDQKVYCWGDNDAGGLGANITTATLPYSMVPLAVYTASGVLANKNVVSIQAGYRLTCVLTEDGVPACWGADASGQLGNGGSNTNARAPSAVLTSGALAGQTIVDIYMGFYHGCVQTDAGKVYCWGSNNFGYLGDNTTVGKNEPTEVLFTNLNFGDGFTTLSLENNQSCGLTLSHELYCWGSTSTGDGKTVSIPTLYKWDNSSFPDEELKYIRSMSISQSHVCYLSASYRIFCVGGNTNGELGIGTWGISTSVAVPTPVNTSGVLANKKIKEIFIVSSVSYALSEENDLYAWGSNTYGHLADGVLSRSAEPTAINFAPRKVRQFAPTQMHACVLLDNAEVHCWGDNSVGELGDGTSGAPRATPMKVEGLLAGKKVTKLFSSPLAHTCAITEDEKVYCWGYNVGGQIGHGGIELFVPSPAEVIWPTALQGHRFKTMALGGQNTCALTEHGKAYCWGTNAEGQLGVSALVTYSLEPIAVETDKIFTKMTAGTSHFCGQTADLKVYCWGSNSEFQLGDLSFTSPFSNSPRLVNGL